MSLFSTRTWVTGDRMTLANVNGLEARINVATYGSISVLSYGADNTGVADSTTAIQGALTAAAAAGGGSVFVPQGVYKINGELLIGDNTTLFSDGPGALLTLPTALAGTNVVGIRNTDQVSGNVRCHVHNIRLLGPENATLVSANVGNSPRGIYFNRVTDGSITDCHISRFNLQGIQADVCVRLKTVGNSVIEIKSGNGISIDAVSVDCVVAHNTIKDVADSGIGTHNGSLRTVIAANTVTNTLFGRGVDVYGAPDTLIDGNTFYEIGGTGTAGQGIQVYPGLSSTIPHRCTIRGNKIYAGNQSGIVISGSAQINDVEIVGNEIIGCGAHAIYIAQLVNRILVAGNLITGNTGAGVYVEHSGANIPTRVFITGNEITGNTTYGIHATSSVTDIKQEANYLNGNTLQACNMPIPTVASTAAVILPTHSGFVNVSGTTNITSIVTGALGEVVTLQFSGALTVTDGSNLKLAGNLVTTADDTLTLRCDGSATWYEVCRSVN